MEGAKFRQVVYRAGTYSNRNCFRFFQHGVQPFDIFPLGVKFRFIKDIWFFLLHSCVGQQLGDTLAGYVPCGFVGNYFCFVVGKLFLIKCCNTSHDACSQQ